MIAGDNLEDRLPADVLALARRLGVPERCSFTKVSLSQIGTLRDSAEAQFKRFRARQTISLRVPEFEWRARTGLASFITITDSLKDGVGDLSVRAFGVIRVGGANNSPALVKGEIMRYLAELTWAPDAIVSNPTLDWAVIDGETLRVSCGPTPSRGQVEFKLDADGRIGSMSASGRPRSEGSLIVEHPWRGRFFDYRKHLGRWLPFQGEVGWILNGQEFIAWRGELTSWTIV